MPTINQLPLRSPVSLGDQIPIYSPNNGDARRTPVSAVVDLVVSGLDLPNTAVLLTGNQTVGGVKTFTNPILGNITGNAGSVTNGVYTTGNQTIGGTKTFSSTIVGDISGNAGTVTNGVYTTGNQTIGGTKTFSSAIVGDISGNAGTVTNGVYTTGNQTIGGTKTFSSTIVGDISGNAATATTATTATTAGSVTNGVYTVGDQTIGGTKTFSVNPILSAGTVNAILTLDGSKQISAVSGLTWDSTKSNLSLGGVTVGQGNVPSLNNIAFGNSVLTTVTTGQSNVAIGASALRLLTGGNSNTAIGVNALRANTTGFSNIAIGSSALFANQTGGQNVAIGDSALQDSTVSGNVAIGVVALAYNTTGTFNTAVGTAALKLVATGSSNTAVGYDALRDFIGGSSNTAIGHQALIGAFPNSNSSSNTAVGAQAGQIITTGGSNTLVGQSAGSSISSAGNNTLIGQSAGSTISTGGSNTVIGRFDGNQNSLDIRTTSNNIVLSDGAGNPRSYYDGANNAWIWRTGASERMRIDSSGNVGIGDTSPSSRGRLSVLATTGAGRQFVVKTDGSTEVRYDDNGNPRAFSLQNYGMTGANQGFALLWRLGDSLANANDAGAIDVISEGTWGATAASRDSAMRFQTVIDGNINERMRITSGGNVGIGTAFPSLRLTVVDTNNQLSINNATNELIVRANSTEAALYMFQAIPLNFYTNNQERMRITSGGDVGIGTSAPGRMLTVSSSSDTSIQSISSGANSYIQATGSAGSVYFGAISTAFGVLAGGTERMRITSAGLVGIGTSSPSQALQVVGSAVVSGTMFMSDDQRVQWGTSSSAYIVGKQGGSGTGLVKIGANGDIVHILASGNVGINEAAPDYVLDVNGSFGFTPGSSVTPVDNGDVVIEATNNTTLTFKLKGSDGTVRTGTITLS